MNDESKYIELSEAAKQLGISEQITLKAYNNNQIGGIMRDGLLLIDAETLDNFNAKDLQVQTITAADAKLLANHRVKRNQGSRTWFMLVGGFVLLLLACSGLMCVRGLHMIRCLST